MGNFLDLLIGLVVGFVIGVTVGVFRNDTYIAAVEATSECEANLPRDQHCIIVAVPEQESE